MNRQIRAILFDKDGTLVDAFAGWIAVNHRLFEDLKTRYGESASRKDLDERLGIEGGRVLAGGLICSGTEEQIYRAHHALLGGRAPGWELFQPEIRALARAWFVKEPPLARPVGRVKETLGSLRSAGFRLGIATSDSYDNAVRDLKDQGAEFIEFWATADRLDRPKPDPESVFLFAKFAGVMAEQVAFVGDSEVDLQAARAAKAGLFVAVRSPTCPPEVLEAADLVVETIEGLEMLLTD